MQSPYPPWVELFSMARRAQLSGDWILAMQLQAAALATLKSADDKLAQKERRAGSNAFPTDGQQGHLREDNQKRRVAAFDAWSAQDVDKSRGR